MGDCGGWRQRLLDAGVEVFAFDNSIFNGNVSGGSEFSRSVLGNSYDESRGG